MLALGEETAVQAVVCSIVWAFRRLKMPRSPEKSARGYALHSVYPQLFFFPTNKIQGFSSPLCVTFSKMLIINFIIRNVRRQLPRNDWKSITFKNANFPCELLHVDNSSLENEAGEISTDHRTITASLYQMWLMASFQWHCIWNFKKIIKNPNIE